MFYQHREGSTHPKIPTRDQHLINKLPVPFFEGSTDDDDGLVVSCSQDIIDSCDFQTHCPSPCPSSSKNMTTLFDTDTKAKITWCLNCRHHVCITCDACPDPEHHIHISHLMQTGEATSTLIMGCYISKEDRQTGQYTDISSHWLVSLCDDEDVVRAFGYLYAIPVVTRGIAHLGDLPIYGGHNSRCTWSRWPHRNEQYAVSDHFFYR